MAEYQIPFSEIIRGVYIVTAGSIEEAERIFNEATESGAVSEEYFEKVWRDGYEDYYVEEISEVA